MPLWYSNTEGGGWDAATQTTDITGQGDTGGSGAQSVGHIFMPTAKTAWYSPSWMDSSAMTSLQVEVSCNSPYTSSTAGYVGIIYWEYPEVIVGKTFVDLSGGGSHTVTIDTTDVDWGKAKGLLVHSGDTATAHLFDLFDSQQLATGPYISGTVTDSTASPCAAVVELFTEDTAPVLVGRRISDASTGAYKIKTKSTDPHTAIRYVAPVSSGAIGTQTEVAQIFSHLTPST